MTKINHPIGVPFKPRLSWPEFKASFLKYARRKRLARRAYAEPVVEEVEIPVEVLREIDEEF